jgi:hypothetical protein
MGLDELAFDEWYHKATTHLLHRFIKCKLDHGALHEHSKTVSRSSLAYPVIQA